MINKVKYVSLDPLLNNVLEITNGNNTWDLHNDADFIEVRYNVLEQMVMLVWNYPNKWFREPGIYHSVEKYLDEHKLDSNNKKIALIFEIVNLVEVKPRDMEMPLTEDACLTDIRKFYEDSNGNVYEDGSITFVFHGGTQIRIKAELIRFETEIE